MSASLKRLASQIDYVVPHMVIFAVMRWIVSFGVTSTVFIVRRKFPLFSNEFGPAFKEARKKMDIVMVIIYVWMAYFFFKDVWVNSNDLTMCQKHTVPRPIAVAASIGLMCYMTTFRLSVSLTSIITLLCAKEKNMLSGMSACTTWLIWMNRTSFPTLAIVCAVSAAHASVCVSASSAALSVSCFCWMCVWTWIYVLVSVCRKGKKLLKSQSSSESEDMSKVR